MKTEYLPYCIKQFGTLLNMTSSDTDLMSQCRLPYRCDSIAFYTYCHWIKSDAISAFRLNNAQ